MEYRIEHDTLGEVKVAADKYWGAQTQRSKMNFQIGPAASMPREIIRQFSIGHLANRLRNTVEHERERGNCQPRTCYKRRETNG